MINETIKLAEKGDSYSNNVLAVARLVEEYKKYNSLIIAFDFDSTLFDLYETGLNTDKVRYLAEVCCKESSIKTILWTTVPDEWSLVYKKALCKEWGLSFDYYNESPTTNNSRKPHMSLLLDDRAGLGSAIEILDKTLTILNLK